MGKTHFDLKKPTTTKQHETRIIKVNNMKVVQKWR